MKTINQKLNSTSLPLITPGGNSSSSVLNNYFKTLEEDIIQLSTNTFQLGQNYNNLLLATNQLQTTIQTMFSGIESRINNLALSNTFLLDMSSGVFLQNTSVCDNRPQYCQTTLPVTNEVDLLVYNDVYSKLYVPDSTYVEVNTGSGWAINAYGKDMLLGNTPMVIPWDSTMSTSNTFSIKAVFPYLYQGITPSVVEFSLIPAFLATITSITYETNTSTVATPLDITYLPGYNPSIYSNNYINQAGPIRVFLPVGLNITAITINFTVSQPTPFGLQFFKLKSLQFAPTGQVVLQNPIGNFSNIQILGQNPNSLAALSYNISGQTVTIQMGSPDLLSTPIITGVIVQ